MRREIERHRTSQRDTHGGTDKETHTHTQRKGESERERGRQGTGQKEPDACVLTLPFIRMVFALEKREERHRALHPDVLPLVHSGAQTQHFSFFFFFSSI